MAQGLSNTLVATVADHALVTRLLAAGVKPGDTFDEMVGGEADESAGPKQRVQGTIHSISEGRSRTGGHNGFAVFEALVAASLTAKQAVKVRADFAFASQNLAVIKETLSVA